MPNIEEILRAKAQRVDETHRLQPGRTALLVVDMQHGFLDEGASLAVPEGREIIPNLQRLIGACRESDVPVIFTEFVYATDVPCLRGDPFGIEHLPVEEGPVDQRPSTGLGSPSNNCLISPHYEKGAESADTVEALAPRPDELIVRGHTYDKFYGTPLDLALRSQDVRHLMITGIVTDVCVNATLMSASARNYRVTAVTDGVATLWPERQQACFDIWEHKFARLGTTEEMIEELREF
jgi:ureidoacrylate peracid hydrolase